MFRRILAIAAVLGLGLAVWWAVRWFQRPPSEVWPSRSETPVETDLDRLGRGLVVRVIDGDTLDLKLHGRTVRVRLLNIDAPERAHGAQVAQCLSGEAKAGLSELAAKGATVLVAGYGTDRFGRTLAGLYDQRGNLLNAQLVGAGLAAPFVVNRQVDLIGPVRAAQADAAAARVGLHAERGCTIPGRVRSAEAGVAELPLRASGKQAARQALARAGPIERELTELAKALNGEARYVLVDGLTSAEVGDLVARVGVANTRLAVVTAALRTQD